MPEVPFVRKADDLALATSHLAQSSSASRFTAGAFEFFILSGQICSRPPGGVPSDGSDHQKRCPAGLPYCYPMLTGSVCIASKKRTKMSTLQAVAPIPAFMAGSMLRHRFGAAVVASAFEGIGFALDQSIATPQHAVAQTI
jgi:hypothetical protein